MKYLIVTTFEIDGHSSSTAIICDSLNTRTRYLKEVLSKEDGGFYPTTNVMKEEDGSETMYGTWDCGQWSINILPFKTFKEITNKERYTQTG